MSVCNALMYSPSALAWGSVLVHDATPSPRNPTMTKFNALRLGNSWRRTDSPAASGTNCAKRSTVRCDRNQSYRSVVSVHSPTLALPPLSPDRAATTLPRGLREITE